jgi:hypothetical protein
MRPGIRIAQHVARFDRQDRRQRRIEDPELHRLSCRFDSVDATAVGSTLRHWRPAIGSPCHFAEQRPDRRKRAQEAARAQQLPPLAPAGT